MRDYDQKPLKDDIKDILGFLWTRRHTREEIEQHLFRCSSDPEFAKLERLVSKAYLMAPTWHERNASGPIAWDLSLERILARMEELQRNPPPEEGEEKLAETLFDHDMGLITEYIDNEMSSAGRAAVERRFVEDPAFWELAEPLIQFYRYQPRPTPLPYWYSREELLAAWDRKPRHPRRK